MSIELATFVGVTILLGFISTAYVRFMMLVHEMSTMYCSCSEPEWTKASEELPPMDCVVAVWDGQKVRTGYLQYRGIEGNEVQGWMVSGETKAVENTVTHWKELNWQLPEPPEEDENV